MGFKRKRDGYRDARPRLSPTELLIARVRPAIAQIGEPSRYAREGLMRSLVHDLGEVPEANFPEVLETIKATVFEQPHKIGYLAFVVAAAPASVSFIVLEMAHDETMKALEQGNAARFKLFFRFLCALHPVVANPEVLIECIWSLLRASPADPRVKVELYKTALLASLYLPLELVSDELQREFAEIALPETSDDTYDFFTGENKPYDPRHLSTLLPEAAKSLRSAQWSANVLAANPLKPVPQGLPPKPARTGEAEGAAGDTEPAVTTQQQNPHTEPEAATESAASEPPQSEGEQASAPTSTTDAPAVDAASEEGGDAKTDAADAEDSSKVPTDVDMEHGEAQDEEAEPKDENSSQLVDVKHTLRPIHIADAPEFQNVAFSPAFFRCYLPLEGNIATVPAEDTIGGILLRDVAIDNMRHMDFNRREVTRQLIALDVFFSRRAFAPPGAWLDQIIAGAKESPPKPTWKVEDIALESVFAQLLDLTDASELPLVYYHSLFIEACVMAPQDIAPVLGRGIRFLFSHLEAADVEILFRTVDWFSHHVSNFAFTWKWNEWSSALTLPEDHPQLVFIKELLAKEVRLSYPQRVKDVLPEEFQPLTSTPPDVPPFKYADDSRADELIDALRGHEMEQARTSLNGLEDKAAQVDLLIHTICHLGNRSVTHATTWIAKAEELVREYAPSDNHELSEKAVESVFDHWKDAPWVGSLIANQFIKVQLIKPSTLVKFVKSNKNILLSSLGWEILTTYVSEARSSLEDLTLEGDYGEWWATKLRKAIGRIAKRAEEKAHQQATLQDTEVNLVDKPEAMDTSMNLTEAPTENENGDGGEDSEAKGPQIPAAENGEPESKRQKLD